MNDPLPAHERLRQNRLVIEQTLLHPVSADFPRSRVMKAVLDPRGRMWLGAAALALVTVKPRMGMKLFKLLPLLRVARGALQK